VTTGSAEIALTETPQSVLDTPSGPQLINDVKSSFNLLSTLDVQPMLGRGFSSKEAEAGRSHVVLLSYSLWHDVFLADQHILGRSVYIDAEPFAVIGVMPEGFLFPIYKNRAQVWTPLENSRLLAAPGPGNPYFKFDSILRVRAGVDPRAVESEISRVQSQIARAANPGQEVATHIRLAPLRETLIGETRPALNALEIAVALVWFIACSNVAGLLLARIAARRSEIAIRGALGAGSARIVRQFLTESLMLSLAGAVVGVLLALTMLRTAEHIIERSLPLQVSFSLNWPLLAALLAFGVFTGFVFGVLPAAVATRLGFAEGLRSQQVSGSIRGHGRLRNVLVVCEVATSLTLVIATGLMLRTLDSLKHVPLGFRTDHIVVTDLTLPGYLYKDRNVGTAAWQPLLDRVQHVPGVRAAALSTVLPIGHSTEWRTLVYKTSWTKGNVGAEVRAASSDLMQVLGVRLLQGRFITDQDVQGSLPVAVVNQTFVHQYLGGRDPVGKQIRFGRIPMTATIVGVLEDLRQDAVTMPSKAEFYISMAQLKRGDALYLPLTGRSMQLAVRTQNNPDAMVQQVRRAIQDENPQLIIDQMRTMDQSVEDSFGTPRLLGGLIFTFGGLALLITVVGLYGLWNYTVTERTREIGIRMALGADRGQVTAMILRQSLLLMVVGITIGIGGSLYANQFLKGFLYGVSKDDPWMFTLGPMILLASGTIATVLPARRAASVDPLQALRSDA
jgi:predicted permease